MMSRPLVENVSGYLKKKKSKAINRIISNTNLRWFELDFNKALFGYKKKKEDKTYKEVFALKEIVGFLPYLDEENAEMSSWKYGFKVKMVTKEFVLFCETEKEKIRWGYAFMFVLGKVPVAKKSYANCIVSSNTNSQNIQKKNEVVLENKEEEIKKENTDKLKANNNKTEDNKEEEEEEEEEGELSKVEEEEQDSKSNEESEKNESKDEEMEKLKEREEELLKKQNELLDKEKELKKKTENNNQSEKEENNNTVFNFSHSEENKDNDNPKEKIKDIKSNLTKDDNNSKKEYIQKDNNSNDGKSPEDNPKQEQINKPEEEDKDEQSEEFKIDDIASFHEDTPNNNVDNKVQLVNNSPIEDNEKKEEEISMSNHSEVHKSISHHSDEKKEEEITKSHHSNENNDYLSQDKPITLKQECEDQDSIQQNTIKEQLNETSLTPINQVPTSQPNILRESIIINESINQPPQSKNDPPVKEDNKSNSNEGASSPNKPPIAFSQNEDTVPKEPTSPFGGESINNIFHNTSIQINPNDLDDWNYYDKDSKPISLEEFSQCNPLKSSTSLKSLQLPDNPKEIHLKRSLADFSEPMYLPISKENPKENNIIHNIYNNYYYVNNSNYIIKNKPCNNSSKSNYINDFINWEPQ